MGGAIKRFGEMLQTVYRHVQNGNEDGLKRGSPTNINRKSIQHSCGD